MSWCSVYKIVYCVSGSGGHPKDIDDDDFNVVIVTVRVREWVAVTVTRCHNYTILAKNGQNVVLCWIPSHVGILGNEKADAAAKTALSLSVTPMKLPATDMYPPITKLIFDKWQEEWNCCAGNKLHGIKPTVGGYKQKTCLSRHDSVLLNRLCFGRTWLTHSYLLSGDDIPECGTCQCPLTVKHILMECVDFKDVRNKHFVASSIKDLFDNVEAHIIDFIKETRFYKQL